ncbi:hypothetical protein A616_16575 [Brevibacillus brevis X23]|nr:hypothetical protein A616_16575 [Brevibacillus brevis X23]
MKKYSIKQVAEIVDSEGLGYAIQSYLNHENVEDEELAAMWKECGELMARIYSKLEDYLE